MNHEDYLIPPDLADHPRKKQKTTVEEARDLIEQAHGLLISASVEAIRREASEHNVEMVNTLAEGKLGDDWDCVKLARISQAVFAIFMKLDDHKS